MGRSWDSRRSACLAPLGLALLAAMSLRARPAGSQAPPKSPASPIPRTIVLPPKLVAGEQATLSVLDSQGRLLPQAKVAFSEGTSVTTDVTGRALFKVPSTPGALIAKIPGLNVSAVAVVQAPGENASQPISQAGGPAASVISYPRVLAAHDRFTMEGAGFHGRADSNRVFLADQLCFVLASSSSSLVVLPGPRVPTGDAILRLFVDGRNVGQFPVSAVQLDFAGPADAPAAGTNGTLTLRVHGSAERLTVEIRNGSPEVIQLVKGNVQRVKTSGGEDNIATVDAKFAASGNYSVSARLISSETNQPDVDNARKRLLQARELASGTWSARIDRLLLKIDTLPVDLPQVRAELKTLLDDKPSASIATLLDSAWRELQQNN